LIAAAAQAPIDAARADSPAADISFRSAQTSRFRQLDHRLDSRQSTFMITQSLGMPIDVYGQTLQAILH
jgi:hypothetical protein